MVQRVESDLFAGFHDKLLRYRARNWAGREVIHERLFSFPPGNGFVLQRQYPGNYSMIFLAGLRSGSPYQILTTRELVWPPTKKPEALAT